MQLNLELNCADYLAQAERVLNVMRSEDYQQQLKRCNRSALFDIKYDARLICIDAEVQTDDELVTTLTYLYTGYDGQPCKDTLDMIGFYLED